MPLYSHLLSLVVAPVGEIVGSKIRTWLAESAHLCYNLCIILAPAALQGWSDRIARDETRR